MERDEVLKNSGRVRGRSVVEVRKQTGWHWVGGAVTLWFCLVLNFHAEQTLLRSGPPDEPFSSFLSSVFRHSQRILQCLCYYCEKFFLFSFFRESSAWKMQGKLRQIINQTIDDAIIITTRLSRVIGVNRRRSVPWLAPFAPCQSFLSDPLRAVQEGLANAPTLHPRSGSASTAFCDVPDGFVSGKSTTLTHSRTK